ncbi:MAG: Trp family transcriptional regulator [Patescibacteria group bacterium]|nr:hypothetical protein [Patescibacteria group bacterium]
MSQISHWKLRPEIWQQVFESLIDSLNKVGKNRRDLLISFLLTPTEKVMIAKRMAAALLLEKGASYQDIYQSVHLSPSTIASIKNRLEENEKYRQLVKGLLSIRRIDDFFSKLAREFVKLGTYGKGNKFWREIKRDLDREARSKIL